MRTISLVQAITVWFSLLVIINISQITNGLKPKEFLQKRDTRNYFGGYQIQPKPCNGTKKLPNSDARAIGPKICMFNNECAQRDGAVVGACMDGFFFGACCQIAPTNIIESTLLMHAQNSNYQQMQQSISNAAAAQSYELYGGSQQADNNEFHEIKHNQYQTQQTGESSSTEQQQQQQVAISQEIENDSIKHENIYASPSPGTVPNFYVEKNSVSVSLPQHSNNDFQLIASSSAHPIRNDDRINYTTELPTKITSTIIDSAAEEASSEFESFEEDHTATQIPSEIISTLNYTQHGIGSILIDNDNHHQQLSDYESESSYVPSVNYENAPQFQSYAGGLSATNPDLVNNKYVLVQTITNDQINKRPTTSGATTISSITTNIDSIESIILMLNNSNHGPSYNVQNIELHPSASSYGTEKPFYGSTSSLSSSSYATTKGPHAADGSTYSLVTTVRPLISTGSSQSSHSTSRPSLSYQEIETKRPEDFHYHDQHLETQNQNSSPYIERITSELNASSPNSTSVEERPLFSQHLENAYPSPSPSSSSVFSSSSSYSSSSSSSSSSPVQSQEAEKEIEDHTDPINGFNDLSSSQSGSQSTSEFNKMPGVGIAYPIDMSYLDEDEANLLNSNEAGEPGNGDLPAKNTFQSVSEPQPIPTNAYNKVTASLLGSHIITSQAINQALSQGTLVTLPQEVVLQAQQPSAIDYIQEQSHSTSSKRPPSPTHITSTTSFRPISNRPSISTTSRPLNKKPINKLNQTQSQTTISSTLQPLAITSSSTNRPIERPTKKPSTIVNRNPTPKPKPFGSSSTQANQSTIQNEIIIAPTRPPAKNPYIPFNKKRPSTSYVTGPTSPRPQIHYDQHKPTTEKNNDNHFSSTTANPSIYSSTFGGGPIYDYSVQPLQVHKVEQSEQNHYNKPTFIKIPSVSQKPPSSTILITPKPTTLQTVTSTTWTQGTSTSSALQQNPNSTPSSATFSSTSYVFSPVVTRRPEYQINTPDYVSLPTVTSNDFDDPGYYGVQNTPRPSVVYNTPAASSTDPSYHIPTDDRPAFPGYYGPTPSYPAFHVPGSFDDKLETGHEPEEIYTSPNDFVNFPPVRNPNLNLSATASSVTTDLELSTPAFVEDIVLKNKMNTLVNKIVESLQDNFEALADMIDDGNNTVNGDTNLSQKKPLTTRKPAARPTSSSTLRPKVTTRKPVVRISTPTSQAATKRPTVPTRKPAVATRRPTTKKPNTRKPTRKVVTTTISGEEIDEGENEIYAVEESETGGAQGKIECGRRPHLKSGRIVGGKGAKFGDYPWQVLVRESTWLGLFTKNKCGGVLITNRYVLTAAHCQPGFLASLVAVLGEFDISGDLERKRSVTKNVKRVIVHREYNAATFANDLALLELESPVHYDSHIVPICMPPDGADYSGKMATVTGWGRLKYGGGIPSVLQEVQVPIIENSVCQEMFHTAGHNKLILSSFLCAGYANGQKDSCEGDSGGPLVIQRPDERYELAGTVSHGIKCAAPYLPGVYMRTTHYKDWLKTVTDTRNYFGGYQIQPKPCNGTKKLPNSDARAIGPKICMFNNECAQRDGAVVGACMDGFFFGACCQIAPTNIIESTLLMHAQNSNYQQMQQSISNAAAAQSYELYGGSQQADNNEFHEIKHNQYQTQQTGESSSTEQQQQQQVAISQEIENDSIKHENIYASPSPGTVPNFYVEKNSVSVSLPQHSNNDFQLIASSSAHPIRNDDRINYTTELPTKITSTIIDSAAEEASSEFESFEEDHTATQIPSEIISTLNYTQHGIGSILIDNDNHHQQLSDYESESSYVPSVNYENAPQFQSYAGGLSATNPDLVNNKYVLVQTITNDQINKRPTTSGATTISSITTNIDSIESIILMLNNSNHGPSYNVQNIELHPSASSYGTEKPFYGSTSSLSSSSYATTKGPHAADGSTYSLVTTVRPLISTGSSQSSHSTSRPSLSYQEIETKRPEDFHYHDQHLETQNQNSSPYIERITSELNASSPNSTSVEERPLFSQHLENAYPSPSPSSSSVFSSSSSYSSSSSSSSSSPVQSQEAEKEIEDHTDPINGFNDLSSSQSGSQSTSEFNKMPGVGIAYPIDMSYLDEDEANLLNSNEAGEPGNGDLPAKNTFQSVSEPQPIPTNAYNKVTASLLGSHIITSQAINQALSQGTLVTLPQEVVLQAQQPSAIDYIQEQSHSTSSKRPPSPTHITSTTSFRPISNRPSISTTSRPLNKKPINKLNQTQSQTTISSTLQPLAITSSSTNRPIERPTKKPSTIVNRNPTPKPKPFGSSSTQANQSTIQNEIIIAPTRPPAKNPYIPFNKKRPSTSYVTGPTSPRPQIHYDQHKPTTEKNNDNHFSSTTANPSIYSSTFGGGPIYDYSVQPLQVHKVEQSEQNHYNKPTFIKIPSVSQKPPSSTILITPKPTTLQTVTSTTWTQGTSTSSALQQNPNSTPSSATFSSTSYVFSPVVTRRPEYQINTPDYVSLPTVTSNDFDDPGYYGVQNTPRPSVVYNTPAASSTDPSYHIPTDDRPAFPGYYGPTPSYPAFHVPGSFDDKLETGHEPEEIYTSPNDFVNFPPVRNPNLNLSATASSVTTDLELSTPAFVEDIVLKNKMNTLVNKIVESLQDNFEALADMIDDGNNTVNGDTNLSQKKPLTTRKPAARPTSSSTLRPKVTTRKPVVRISTPTSQAATKRPTVPTRKPAVATRRPTTKKPNTRKPTRKVVTTTISGEEIDEGENEIYAVEESETGGAQGKIECGRRPHLKSGRIVGGKGAKFGDYPWQVLVRESTWLGLFTKNKCGGVLITNRYVLTAAHCQPGFLASLVAVLGEFDISGDLERKRSVTKNVKRVIVHREYNAATFANDLALLELESPVHYDSHIVPICMPPDGADYSGKMATVTGWGRLKYGGGIPSVLQEVQVPIIENSVCQEMFHTAGHNKLILSSFLCAGYANGQKDSCEGDSGGPLVIQRPDERYELAGTVSHGIKCAAPYLPGVYMRTTHYKDWLKTVTGVK